MTQTIKVGDDSKGGDDSYDVSDEDLLMRHRVSSPPLHYYSSDDDENDNISSSKLVADNAKATAIVCKEKTRHDSICGAPFVIPAHGRESIITTLVPNSIFFVDTLCDIPLKAMHCHSLVDSSRPSVFGYVLHDFELGRDPPIAALVGDSRFGFG